MKLFENLNTEVGTTTFGFISIAKEGDKIIAECPCSRREGAISGVFAELRKIANAKE